jgi:hypothetical protein
MSGVLSLLIGSGGPEFFVYTTAINSSGDGGTIEASVQYQSDGDIQVDSTELTGDVGDWITPKSLAHNGCTIRAHVDSGTLSIGTVDTDLALSSSQGWGVSQASVGSVSATITITIKNAGGGTVKSGQVTLSATRNS